LEYRHLRVKYSSSFACRIAQRRHQESTMSLSLVLITLALLCGDVQAVRLHAADQADGPSIELLPDGHARQVVVLQEQLEEEHEEAGVPDPFSRLYGKHCGGTSISPTWASGEDSRYGKDYHYDLAGCKAMCMQHSDCLGFVLRDSDKQCSFWKGGTLVPRNFAGHHCYVKKHDHDHDDHAHDHNGHDHDHNRADPNHGLNTNDYSSIRQMKANGWTFALTNYNMANRGVRNGGCAGGWFGWSGGNRVGSLSTSLHGSGLCTLTFANCWNAGTVRVYVHGKKVAGASPRKTRQTSFSFKDGDKLVLRDEGANSVIQLKSISCEQQDSSQEHALHYDYIGEGTLLSRRKEYFRAAQYTSIGRSEDDIRHVLEPECDRLTGCVGIHVHPTALRGALLLDARSTFPPPRPTGAKDDWLGWSDSKAMGPAADRASASVGKGWNGWHAYRKAVEPAVDCQLSSWRQWSRCSRRCGGGTSTRSRSVVRNEANGGRACGRLRRLRQSRPCNSQSCPARCMDTPGWTNGEGFTCEQYSSPEVHKGPWCRDGEVVPGKKWTLGEKYRWPEFNCCVCGKSQGDSHRSDRR